jgi:hypothetical protein
MALDLLNQLHARNIEWPFDQGQAQTRIQLMMSAITDSSHGVAIDEGKGNESS